MIVPGLMSMIAGATAIAAGLVDRRNPGWLDSWNVNRAIPAAGTRGRHQVDVFVVVLGAVLVMTGVVLAAL